MGCSWQWIDSGSAGFSPWLHWAGASFRCALCFLLPSLCRRNMPGAAVSCLHTAHWIRDRDSDGVKTNLDLCSDSQPIFTLHAGVAAWGGKARNGGHRSLIQWVIKNIIKSYLPKLAIKYSDVRGNLFLISHILLTASVGDTSIVWGSFIFPFNHLSVWPFSDEFIKGAAYISP